MTKSKRDIGEEVRREVMSDAFVDRALDAATDFDLPMQEMVMENAWGSTWTRDEHLPKKTRSIATISMLVALRATNELKGHVWGALRNGCTKEEIREVIMHAAVYCGFPAALSAFNVAKEVIADWEAEK